TSRHKQDSVVRQGTLNGLNLRSDARGETNHVTESRLHTGLQAVHNRGTLSTQGKAHLPANARSGTPGPTDSLTGPRSDPAYETAPRTVRTVPSLVLATTPRVSNRRTDPLDSTLGIVRLVANNTRNSSPDLLRPVSRVVLGVTPVPRDSRTNRAGRRQRGIRSFANNARDSRPPGTCLVASRTLVFTPVVRDSRPDHGDVSVSLVGGVGNGVLSHRPDVASPDAEADLRLQGRTHDGTGAVTGDGRGRLVEPHEHTGNPGHGRGCSRSHRLRHRVDERADDLTGSHAAGVGGPGCGLGEALGNGLRDLLETRGDPRPHTVKRGVHRVAEGALLACDRVGKRDTEHIADAERNLGDNGKGSETL